MTKLSTVLFSSVTLAFSSLVFAAGDHDAQTQTQGVEQGQGLEQGQSIEQGQGLESESMQTQAFSEVDADNSGTLDESEAQVANIPDFQAADENQDGELDRNEYYAAVTERQS